MRALRHEVSWRKGVPEGRPRVPLRKPAPSSAFFGTPLFLFEQQELQSPQHASGHSSIHVPGAFPCYFSCATMGTLPPTSSVPDSSTSQGAFAVSLDKQTAGWLFSGAIAARVGAAVVEEPAALSVAGLGLSFARRLEERLILARGQRGADVFLHERPLAAPFASITDLQGVGGSGTEHGAPLKCPSLKKGRRPIVRVIAAASITALRGGLGSM